MEVTAGSSCRDITRESKRDMSLADSHPQLVQIFQLGNSSNNCPIIGWLWFQAAYFKASTGQQQVWWSWGAPPHTTFVWSSPVHPRASKAPRHGRCFGCAHPGLKKTSTASAKNIACFFSELYSVHIEQINKLQTAEVKKESPVAFLYFLHFF